MIFDPTAIAAFITANMTWIALILFFLLFIEGILGIGYFLPGATVLLAVGALIGSGVAPPWLAFFGAAGGAVLGGETNYWLGYRLRKRLPTFWPFSRYSNLLPRCQAFIHRHGGKSILFGRFTKPLRPTITAVAGMLSMPRQRFSLFNLLAGILWTALWLFGGAAITAMTGFDPEQAVTLVMGVLIAAVLIALGAFQMERWRRRRGERQRDTD